MSGGLKRCLPAVLGWLALLAVCCLTAAVEAELQHRRPSANTAETENADPFEVGKRASMRTRPRHCAIHRNDALYSIVDRICEMCFEMFRHQDPNLRAKCRSRCFRNTQFTTCVSIFNPSLELDVVPMRRRQQN